jgi:hypothetical protein
MKPYRTKALINFFTYFNDFLKYRLAVAYIICIYLIKCQYPRIVIPSHCQIVVFGVFLFEPIVPPGLIFGQRTAERGGVSAVADVVRYADLGTGWHGCRRRKWAVRS